MTSVGKGFIEKFNRELKKLDKARDKFLLDRNESYLIKAVDSFLKSYGK